MKHPSLSTPIHAPLPVVLLLVATAVLLWHALASPPAWTLELGQPDDTRFTTRFFLPEEQDGTTFRWSGPKSHFLLHGAPPGALLLDLRLHGGERALNGDWHMHLAHAPEGEGVPLATLTMAPDWRVYRVLLPPGAASDGLQATPLYLTSNDYLYVARDHRYLGTPVDWVRVAPIAHSKGGAIQWGIPLLRALLLTWGVALVAGLVWRLQPPTAHTTTTRSALMRWLVFVIPLLCALALVWYAYLSPYKLAWALPPLPWILGIATLLLITTGERRWVTGSRYQVAALVLLVLAQVLFHTRWSIVVGLALAFGGILLFAISNGERATDDPPHSPCLPQHTSRIRRYLPLLLVLFVALGLRLYRISDLPYGLWRDEVRHGMFAIRMLEVPDYRPVYISTGGVNMPALGFYPFALAIALWGPHIWSMRLVTALAGALTVLPLYALVYRLLGRRDVALLAAALLTVSSWHITLSRFGFPSIIEPLLMLTGLWLIVSATEHAHPTTAQRETLRCVCRAGWCCVVAGVLLGISAQMYHTGRAVPLVAGALALLMLYGRWSTRRSRRDNEHHPPRSLLATPFVRNWLLVLPGFLLAIAPLAVYAVQQTDAYNNRVSAVFLLSEAALRGQPPLAALDAAIGKHTLMFNVEGDANGRHHAPHYPLLDAVTGLGLLVGCAVLLRHWRDWRMLFLAAALTITLLPSLFAVQGPHAMRSIGAIAFACTIAALGWVEIGRLLLRWVAAWRVRALLSVGVVALALALNVWVYFVAMPVIPGVWQSFYPIHTRVGVYVRQVADEQGSEFARQVYVPQGLMENDVFTYLVYGLPVQTFKGDSLSRPADPGALFVLSGYSHEKNVENLRPYIGDDPPLVQQGPPLPGSDKPSFFVYRQK